ncbi:MAG: protein-disulfide reductase DsbD domain-containing protein [Arenibacterium sp.]
MTRLSRFAAALFGMFVPMTLHAQASLEEIVQLELLQGGMTSDGTYQTAIRLDMADGWKTYWRRPGDAGIPPRLVWNGSRNVAAAEETWPTPAVFDQSGMRSVGYISQLVLPVKITPKQSSKKVRLRGKIEFGICQEVCIPAALNFNAELDPDAPRHPTIAAALAARPYSETEAGVRSATCALSPTEDGLKITAKLDLPATGGDEFVVFEPDNPKIWSSEAVVSRNRNVLTATSELIHVDGDPYLLDRSALRITVIGQRHAVDIQGCSAN